MYIIVHANMLHLFVDLNLNENNEYDYVRDVVQCWNNPSYAEIATSTSAVNNVGVEAVLFSWRQCLLTQLVIIGLCWVRHCLFLLLLI